MTKPTRTPFNKRPKKVVPSVDMMNDESRLLSFAAEYFRIYQGYLIGINRVNNVVTPVYLKTPPIMADDMIRSLVSGLFRKDDVFGDISISVTSVLRTSVSVCVKKGNLPKTHHLIKTTT